MANINEILARAAALRKETALNSIDPERAGGIMYDTLLALNELWLQQGAALVISKIYDSVAAMNADTSPVSDLTGKPIRPGMVVVIASSDSDNGSVYRYNGTSSPSWSLVGEIANLEPVDSLDSDSTSLPLAAHQGKVLDGKISQLGQKLDGFVLSGVSSSYLVIFQNGIIPTGTIIENTGDVQLQLADGDISAGTNTHRQNLNAGSSWLSTFDITYARTASGSGNYGLTVYGSFVSYAKNQNLPDAFKTIARQNIDAPKTSDLNVYIKKTEQTLSASESAQVAANLNMTDTWSGTGSGVFVSQKGIRNGVNRAQQEKGYRVCNTGAGTAEKVIAEYSTGITTMTKDVVYVVLFTRTNTVDSNVTLKLEYSSAYPMYYFGAPVTSTNCWKAGDKLLIWWDGTNFQSVCISDGKERFEFLENNRTLIFNPKNYAMRCFHHDNFARTETGYAIGKNAPDAYNVNDYEYVSSDSYDDGLVVDDGATWASNNSRTETYSLRRIAKTHGPYACIETNAPTNRMNGIAWNVVDVNNFNAIRCSTYITTSEDTVYTRFTFDYIKVVGGGETVVETKSFRIRSMDFSAPGEVYMPQTMQLYFLNGDLHIFIDGEYANSIYVGKVDNSFCLFARKNATYHYAFVNGFDLQDKKELDFFRPIDNNNKSVPHTNLDFIAENYEMTDEVTRWSPRAEHFTIHSTDTPISNGIRCERGLIINPSDANSALYPFCKQLRDLRFSFDVLFPTTADFDTAQVSYHDTFFQIHDSISISSRADVPLTLALIGGAVHIRQTGTRVVSQGTVDVYASWAQLFNVERGKWYHFDIILHERYDENQHPYTEILVDGQPVYKSYYPNCYNDPIAGFPKYGEYKNGWDNVTVADRYFDNVIMEY